MKTLARACSALTVLCVLPLGVANGSDLRGSPASMRLQHEIAKRHDYTFLRTPEQVKKFVAEDRLEKVESGPYLLVHNVSFPYARPAVKLFVERLARQYYAAHGERLVVTSLTRPISRQPSNAHKLSVHPAGMAVDFRIPQNGVARAWLEKTLLSLERAGVLDATRERNPPHYHVAVFPSKYENYVERLTKMPAYAAASTVAEQSRVEEEGFEETASVAASLEPADSIDALHDTHHAHPEDSLSEPVVSAVAREREQPRAPLYAALGVTGFLLVGGRVIRRRRSREIDAFVQE